MEHRWGKRIPTDIAVRLRCPTGNEFDGRIVNISGSGALISVRCPLNLLLRIDIDLAGRSIPSFVSRVATDGVGVEWCLPSRDLLRIAARARSGGLRRLLPDLLHEGSSLNWQLGADRGGASRVELSDLISISNRCDERRRRISGQFARAPRIRNWMQNHCCLARSNGRPSETRISVVSLPGRRLEPDPCTQPQACIDLQ